MSNAQKERWRKRPPKYKTNEQGVDIRSVNAKSNKNILSNLKIGSISCRIPIVQ